MYRKGPIWGAWVHVFACIVMYRKRRFDSCTEYVYRGARSIHVFGIGKIHEIHARYKGGQPEWRRGTTQYMPKRWQHGDTRMSGKFGPKSGGNPPPIRSDGVQVRRDRIPAGQAQPRCCNDEALSYRKSQADQPPRLRPATPRASLTVQTQRHHRP